MSTLDESNTTQEKALQINTSGIRFGAFAEIGASQEVARWFFHVGKASNTIAKTISAYDMAISDAIYGATSHYVSRARLGAMLDREYRLIIERLDAKRGDRDAFFAFADTVATHGSSRSSGGHGWMGIRFQTQPKSEESEIIIHLEMRDALAINQQEAVGIVGVNLIHGAFYFPDDPVKLIRGLMDGLDRRRIEIDLIKFSGAAFHNVDNRLMALQLVELGLTDAVMFTADREVVQPSEVLHDHPVFVERGSFRPITNITLSLRDCALRQLREANPAPPPDPVVLMEMTLNNLMSGPSVDHQDFLARADVLAALSATVMISNFTRFDLVSAYLRQYTSKRLATVVGVPTLRAIFDEQYYTELDGGILEGVGRLFNGDTKLLVYPGISAETGQVETAADIAIPPKLKHLYAYLLDNRFIEPIQQFSTDQLEVSPADVLQKIQSGDGSWVDFVPPAAAALIQRDKLFGLAAGS